MGKKIGKKLKNLALTAGIAAVGLGCSGPENNLEKMGYESQYGSNIYTNGVDEIIYDMNEDKHYNKGDYMVFTATDGSGFTLKNLGTNIFGNVKETVVARSK
ncbi:MAG: hypothetical protein LBM01_00435 [Christensenellaceae bacterium]|jgi:hypothetical protein|nr:hypothetical protein [Christensenellaceae bacterium]